MNMSVIAKAYWRAVKRGSRKYSTIPEEAKPFVAALAREELEAGKITQEEFDKLVGAE